MKGHIMKIIAAFAILLISVFIFPACSEDDPVTPQEEHFEAIGVVLSNSGIRIASILRGETADTLHVEVDELSDHIEVSFYDEDERIIDAPDDADKTLSWEIGDPTILEVHQHEGHEGEWRAPLHDFR